MVEGIEGATYIQQGGHHVRWASAHILVLSVSYSDRLRLAVGIRVLMHYTEFIQRSLDTFPKCSVCIVQRVSQVAYDFCVNAMLF